MSEYLSAQTESVTITDMPFGIPVGREAYLPDDDNTNVDLRKSVFGARSIVEIDAGRQRFVVAEVPGPEQADLEMSDVDNTGAHSDGSSFILAHLGDDGTVARQPLDWGGRQLLIGRGEETTEYEDEKVSKFDIDPAYGEDAEFGERQYVVSLGNGRLVVENMTSSGDLHVRYSSAIVFEDEIERSNEDEEVWPELNDEYSSRKAEDSVSFDIPSLTFEKPELKPDPDRIIETGNRKFGLSHIIRSPGMRPMAVMQTTADINGAETQVSRLLYKTNSDNGWRATLGIDEESGGFIKILDEEGHYTQEMKLVPEIIELLEREEADNLYIDDEGLSNEAWIHFQKAVYGMSNTARNEIRYYRDDEADVILAPARQLSVGKLTLSALNYINEAGYDSIGAYLESLDTVFEALPDFMPDFTVPPYASRQSRHTLLGDSTIESYPALYNGKAVTWDVAYDGQGRVWIDDLVLADAAVTSYGTRTPIFHGGIFAGKPIDYTGSQTAGLNDSERRPLRTEGPFAKGYVDITPLYDRLAPIKMFRKAKQLQRAA